MTRAQILASVIELSGRGDLGDDLNSGSGKVTKGQFFLNAGLKYLDTTQKNPESRKTFLKDIAQGAYKLQFQYCRSINRVEIMCEDGRTEVEKVPLEELRESYVENPSELTQGVPKYYAPDIIFLATEQRALDATAEGSVFTYDYYSLLYQQSGYSGILFMPPAEKVFTVSVIGDWFTVMENEADVNYWSVVYPELLIQATLFAIEVFYRNTTGMSDAINAMAPFLKGIDHNLVEQDMAGINQMEG